MEYFVGIDLHGSNSYIGIINETGDRMLNQRTPNELTTIIQVLKPFQKNIKNIAIEATFNWYWLVDGLKDEGYNLNLANAAAINQYKGIKHTDDKSDAFWLAEMLRLKILPTGYIYPREQRPVRDLLRRRMQLVQHRTSFSLSLNSMTRNWTSSSFPSSERKSLSPQLIMDKFPDPHTAMSAQVICNITHQLDKDITCIEKEILKTVRLTKEYKKLLTVWGIGEILAMTIMLETGDIHRFKTVGDYASYCRCVPTDKTSNGKTKGKGNKKNGNKYLAWAYVEAANFMQRCYPQAKKWFQRKTSKRKRVVAVKALGHKISRACYFIMRDDVVFDPSKLFA